MEIGIPQSILSTYGEVVFNVLDGTASSADSLAGTGYTIKAPVGLPDGCGYYVTFVGGNDMAPIRNPITHRPHKHGAIVHRFRKAPVVVHVEGQILGNTPTNRRVLADHLRDVLNPILQAGVFGQPNEAIGRYFWKPAGQPIRFRAVRLYDPLVIEPQSPGSAAPKTFSFSLVSEHAEALTYSQAVTTIAANSSAVIANNGNTETWPVVKVYGVTTSGFTLSNGTHRLRWGQGRDPAPVAIRGDYIEIDMYRQTMYWNGDQANALRFLHMRDSDFWSIPRGGKTVSIVGAGPITVLSNDAWVG